MTFVKGKSADIQNGFWERNALQALAEAEREIVDIRDLRAAEVDTGQLTHTLEAVRLNARQRAS